MAITIERKSKDSEPTNYVCVCVCERDYTNLKVKTSKMPKKIYN